MSKTRQKLVHLKWFHEFIQGSFSKFTIFRFQLLDALRIKNLSNGCSHKYDPSVFLFLQSNFWRVFDIWPNCEMGGREQGKGSQAKSQTAGFTIVHTLSMLWYIPSTGSDIRVRACAHM